MTLVKILFLLIAINTLQTLAARSTRFPVGGLFNTENLQSSERAFENIVKTSATNAYHGRLIKLKVVDSYSTALEMCPFTSDNKSIVALIDARPTNGICDTTCLLCNKLNIPHLSLGWEPTETIATDSYTLLYHPPPELISKAYATLIKDLQWDKFTFLYEDDGSFIRQQEIINTWPYNQDRILFRQLYPDGDNRETFKYLIKVMRMSYHVIDCDVNNIRKYMLEIVQVDTATQYQSFILTALDAYTVNLEDIRELMANVSTLHLTTQDEYKYKDIIDMSKPNVTARLEAALTADALKHLDKAIRSIIEKGSHREDDENDATVYIPRSGFPDPPDLCFRDTIEDYTIAAWPLGPLLRDELLATTAVGLTGNIEFDNNGKRTNFKLHYSKLSSLSKITLVGYWDSQQDMFKYVHDVTDRSSLGRKSKIMVVSRKEEPYFMIETSNETGITYKGYAVDLIYHIFQNEQLKNLTYEFYKVPDDKYGNPIVGTRKWDGLIGELLEHNADLAICDLTITSERNAVVDFSTPFMSLGISVLSKEPPPQEPDMFSFINPLALDVWLFLATTYIIVSFVLLICARMSQADWVNPHPCNQQPENLQNIWSLYNCMWLTMGAIMTQGCDILPRAAGSRWVTGMWWFFALIITASYTANMSTFLSNSRRSNQITDVKELSEQNKVSYGAVYNASTYRFFEASNDSVYQKIWNVMKSAKPTVFMHSNDEGRDRVLRSKGNYVFFMESTAIEYYMKKNCTLKMLGSKLDSKDYGIAMPKNFPHKTLVDNAILALQESGKLTDLHNKWWKGESNTESCETTESEEDSGSLQMKNTSGIFLVLAIGGILGLIVAVIDFMLHARQICVKEKVTFKEALASEWRASLNPRALHKPAAPPRSAPPSTASPSPQRERSKSRAVSVLRAASSFINFDEIY